MVPEERRVEAREDDLEHDRSRGEGRDPGKEPVSLGRAHARLLTRRSPARIHVGARRTTGEAAKRRPMLSWLELDKVNFVGTFKAAPVREELNEPVIKEQLIVEYYSR